MAIKPVQILITAKDKASGVFDLLKKNALSLGATVAAYFGAKSFLGAIQGAAEFEAKLSEVKAVVGGTAADMVLLRKAAEDAGATTKFSATEGADALGNLARAGLSVKDSIAALPPTLQLAQAGQIGLAESAEIVTRSLAGFGLQADQSGRIADVLAKGANASNTSVAGLAQALSYAAPTAKSLNLSLETTVALLGKFADGGIDASRGGTALNAILSQFLDPASKFRSELAAMGITTNDFEEALRQLAAAGPAGQKAILAVGTEAGPALRALLNQGIGAFDDLKKKLQEASGSAAEFARLVEDNTTGAALGLASAWDTVKIALATPVLPVLKDGIQQLTGVLREAVANGTVGKFGDAIAKGFQAALEWGKRFLAEVDVEALVASMQSGADRVGAAFDQVSRYATNAGNTVQTAWGVMGAGANVVLTGIYALGTAFSATATTIVKGAILASEALAKIAITDSAKAKLLADAEAMRGTLAGLQGVTQEFVIKANQSMDGVATSAQLARDGWAGLTGATQEAAAEAAVGNATFQSVAETLKEVGGDATAMGQKTQAAAILQTEAARKVSAEVIELKSNFEAALAAGDSSTALAVLESLRVKTVELNGELAKTAPGIDRLGGALKTLGITSDKELKTAADASRTLYDQVVSAGGSAREAGAAFKKMADDAIASGDQGAIAFAKSQAAARGFEVTVDSAGNTVVKSMNDAKTATEGAGNAANQAAGGYRNMAQSAGDAAAAAKRLAEVNARYSRPGEGSQQKGNEASYDPGRAGPYSSPRDKGPVNGNGQTQAEFQRMERLGGQNAVDNTLAFRLRDELKAGTLGPEDAADIKAAIAALDQNEAVNRDLDRFGGAFSTAGAADRDEWRNIRTQLAQALQTQKIGQRVAVDINVGGGTETVETDEAGARKLVKALQKAGLAAGR